MSNQPKIYWTPAEYLAHERVADSKHEYWAGAVYAMAGASARHNLIVTNAIAELRTQLKSRRSCTVYPSDLRVKISATGLYTYPDVVVVCGEPQFEDDVQDTLLNPTVIVEVLSKSTESYDRGAKFEHYRTLDSLTEYILVAQNSYHIDHYVRQPDAQWLFSEAKELEHVVGLSSIGCTLAVAELYDKVELPLRPRVLKEMNQIEHYSTQ